MKHYFGGDVEIKAAGTTFRVGDHRYALINADEDYELETPAMETLRNFTWFFEASEVAAAWRAVESSEEKMLDEPEREGKTPEFIAGANDMTDGLLAARGQLYEAWVSGALSPVCIEAHGMRVLHELIDRQMRLRGDLFRLSARKASTRLEIYRRLARAVEYAHTDTAEILTLSALARAAGMSKFHFAKCFAEFYSESPARYVQTLRIKRAAESIESGRVSISEASRAVGFAEPASFSRAFRRVLGASPSRWARRQKPIRR